MSILETLGLAGAGIVAIEEDVIDDEPTPDELASLDEEEPGEVALREDAAPDIIRIYLQEIGRQTRLTPAEEIELAQAIEEPSNIRIELEQCPSGAKHDRLARKLAKAERHAKQARERFILANLRLVVHYSYWFDNRGVPLLDLIQEGNLGLIRAVEKYDWRAGFRFSTYATWWIQQALRKAIHTQERGIRLPVHANDELASISRAEGELAQELGRTPRPQEVADRVGLTTHRIAHLRAVTRQPLGIDESVDSKKGGDSNDITYADIISDEDHLRAEAEVEAKVVKGAMLVALRELTPREALVIILRRGLVSGTPLTLAQTGEQIGVSREMARQIEIRAMAKLRQDATLRNLYLPDTPVAERTGA